MCAARGGGSLLKCKPVFSPDGRFVICGSGCTVSVHCISSDLCTRSLRSHRDTVTSLVINPSNQFQVFSSSLDKKIILWDYVDGVLLHKFELRYPVCLMFHSGQDPAGFYGILQIDADPKNASLSYFSLEKTFKRKSVKLNFLLRGVHSDPQHSAVGCKGSYVAYVKSKTKVGILMPKEKNDYLVKFEQRVTCLACHPVDYIIAAGCKEGVIFLCRNFIGPGARHVITKLHWHSLDVRCLTFSTEGSYLLSGGYECVLAKWMTETSMKKPDTLPRLSAPIVNISCSLDNQHYAVSYIDNGVQIIGCNFTRGPTIQGLVQADEEFRTVHGLCRSQSVGLLYDSRSGSLVTNGRPGQLQFFSVDSGCQLLNLNVVGHNYVSPENLCNPLIPTDVECAAFDETGDWLATVERRDDGLTAVEARLKFWLYSKEKNSFVLNTCVNMPHQSTVNRVMFSPHRLPSSDQMPVAVTSCIDGNFKLWSLSINTDDLDKKLSWDCTSVGFYRQKPAGDVSFSEDGSVLAVVFKDVITLWDPDYNTMHQDIISLGSSEVTIRRVVFGRQSCSHLMLFTTDDKLYSWNLINFAVEWSLLLAVATITANPASDVVAIFTQDSRLMILTPKSSKSIYRNGNIGSSQVSAAQFVPCKSPGSDTGALHWQNTARLYFMNNNQELFTLLYADELEDECVPNVKLEQNLPRSVLSMMVAEQTSSGVPPSQQVARNDQLSRTDSKFVDEVLSNPLHGMPAMTTLCMAFIESLLVRTKSSKSGEESDDEDDEKEDTAPAVSASSDEESSMDTS